MAKRCPDCDVEMVETNYDTTGTYDKIRLKDDGVRGALGLSHGRTAYAHVCPECSLVRFYVE